jgi:adenosine kinase
MRTLICGSLAFDTIMVFPDRFARHILPEQTHVLSVSFQISDMRREWGGCAGNIAYNLHALGGDPVVMGTLGSDGGAYRERLRALGIAIDGVRVIDDAYTAQAFIITDHDDNQITAFHPGAMNRSHVVHVDDVAGVGLGIVSPDGKEGMKQHVAEFAARGIPFVFDPGQGLPLFDGNELAQMIEHASYLTLNDYEAKLLADRTGWSIADIAERVDGLVVTMGGEGSIIHAGGATYAIPAVRPSAIVDPTGCGDAYRAGLLYGIGTIGIGSRQASSPR